MTDAADRLQNVRDKIAQAAILSNRRPESVTLVAVSKGRSSDEIEAVIAAGQRHFGENRVQEALGKWPPLLQKYPDVRMHAIGRLQTNKAVEAVSLFDVIHSIDRPSLLDALCKAALKTDRRPSVYVQVNLGEEDQKGGCMPRHTGDLISAVRASPLPLAGLMAIPPAELDPAPFFALLAEIAHRHDVGGLSMGMSNDYPTAVMLGATAVRVGTALFEG